jgi:hypothetical protein
LYHLEFEAELPGGAVKQELADQQEIEADNDIDEQAVGEYRKN